MTNEAAKSVLTKIQHRYLSALLLCGLLWLPQASATVGPVDASQIGSKPLSLSQYFGTLEDASTKLTLADIQTADISEQFEYGHPADRALAYGTRSAPYWFRFRLSNPTAQPLKRIIELEFPRISNIQFYQPTDTGTYARILTGAAQPFATRPYANRNFVFPVTLPAHSEQTYYFRLQANTNLLVPAQIWSPDSFHAYERRDYMIQAWYYGIATAMGLFNLLLFIALREKIYFLYVIFASVTVVTFAAFFGLANEFLWPTAGIWAEKAMSITAVLQATVFAIFTRHMLNTPVIIPRLNRGLMIVLATLIACLIGDIFSLPGAFVIGQIFVIVVYMLIFAIAFYCVLIHERTAYFFVIAFTFYLVGVITYTLTSMGVVPYSTLTANAGQIGSGLEMLLLAFALADRFNRIRREKFLAQEEVLQSKQELLDSVKASERQLEDRVERRTEELHVAMRKLEELSVTDALTGIANRRRFDAVLNTEWKRAERANLPLALAMLDVDHFKKFNDRYGHLQGDNCLKKVAEALAENISRPGELIARYGGEEFVFISPNTDGNLAVKLAQKVCDTLRAFGISHADSDVGYVTTSIGVAAVIPQQGKSPDSLIKAADAALYRAKAGGRNQVVLAPND